jgi:hypothetical protein
MPPTLAGHSPRYICLLAVANMLPKTRQRLLTRVGAMAGLASPGAQEAPRKRGEKERLRDIHISGRTQKGGNDDRGSSQHF